MLYIDVFRDFCMNGLGGGTRLRYVQMRSRRAGTAHRGRRSAAPARARYRTKTEKFAFGTANCTGTFQCHSNNEHAIPRDRSSDKLGRGSRSSGCLAVVVVLLFAHLGRWWCEEAPDGGGFLCFGRELPPRARPDRRPDLRGGSCCAAGLRSLRFHFGDFASRAWRVLSGIRKKIGV